MSTALNIPEGFQSTTFQSSIGFQNPSNWSAAKATGVMVQGIYEGLTEVDSYGKQNFKFTSTAISTVIGKDGSERELPEGSIIIINTSASLKNKMDDVEVGTETVVVYEGQNKLTKGPYKGKLAHSYNVLTRK